jgi:hypothetical protein
MNRLQCSYQAVPFNAGMRWKSKRAAVVLSLRSLFFSDTWGDEFLEKIGFSGRQH